jgi:hypothetical protein
VRRASEIFDGEVGVEVRVGRAGVGVTEPERDRSIGAYLGLVPTESSSGTSRSQGAITKTGNGHARRLLIEAAWHHRKPYRPGSPELRRRWDAASAPARVRGQQANRRLYARWQRFDARGKRPAVANTAIARELAGWCWSLAVLDNRTPPHELSEHALTVTAAPGSDPRAHYEQFTCPASE